MGLEDDEIDGGDGIATDDCKNKEMLPLDALSKLSLNDGSQQTEVEDRASSDSKSNRNPIFQNVGNINRKNASLWYLNHSNIIAVPPRASSVSAVPPRTSSISAVPSRTSSVSAVPPGTSSISAVPPGTSSVSAVPSMISSVSAVPSRTFSVGAVPSRTSSMQRSLDNRAVTIISSSFSSENVPWRRRSHPPDMLGWLKAPAPRATKMDNMDPRELSSSKIEISGNVRATAPKAPFTGNSGDGPSLEITFSHLSVGNVPWRICRQPLVPPPAPPRAQEIDEEDPESCYLKGDSSDDDDDSTTMAVRGPMVFSPLEQARSHPYHKPCIRPLINNGGFCSVDESAAQGAAVQSSSSSPHSQVGLCKVQKILAGGGIVQDEAPEAPVAELQTRDQAPAAEPSLSFIDIAHILSRSPNGLAAPIWGFRTNQDDSPQFKVSCGSPQSMVGYGSPQSVVSSANPQSVVGSGSPLSLIISGSPQTMVSSGSPQSVVVSANPPYVVGTRNPLSLLIPGSPQTMVSSGSPQSVVGSANPQSVVCSGSPQSVFSSGSPQSIVGFGSPLSLIGFGSPQSVLNSESLQSVVCSESLQAMVNSESPHSMVISGSLLSVIGTGRPQSVVGPESPRAIVNSGSPHSEINSGSLHSEVNSGSLHSEVNSGRPQSIICFGSPQPVISSGSPQTDCSHYSSPPMIGYPNGESEVAAPAMTGLSVMSSSTAQISSTDVGGSMLQEATSTKLEDQCEMEDPDDRPDDEMVCWLQFYKLDDLEFDKSVYDAVKFFDCLDEDLRLRTLDTSPNLTATSENCQGTLSSPLLNQAAKQNGVLEPYDPALNSQRVQVPQTPPFQVAQTAAPLDRPPPPPQAVVLVEPAQTAINSGARGVQVPLLPNASRPQAPPKGHRKKSREMQGLPPKLLTANVSSKYERRMREFKPILPNSRQADVPPTRGDIHAPLVITIPPVDLPIPKGTEGSLNPATIPMRTHPKYGEEYLRLTSDEDGDMNLYIAVANDNLDLMHAIVDKNGNNKDCIDARNDKGQMPLFTAVLMNNVDLTKCLLHNGAEPNPSCTGGNTPLHLLAMRGPEFLEVGRVLCKERGISLNKTNDKGLTPLHVAVQHHNQSQDMTPFIRMLLSHGADLSFWEPCSRRTPLHMAVERRLPELVTAICSSCTNIAAAVNVSSYKGTALHCAAMLNKTSESVQLEIVKTLLQHGASPSARCTYLKNRFPKDLVRNERKRVKDLLKISRK